MTYADLIAALSFYTQAEQPDPSFTLATPTFITLAEQRILRRLNLAASSGENKSLSTTIGGKVLNLGAMSGQFVSDGTPLAYQFPVVVEAIAARVGVRWVPFQLVSLDFLNLIWPDDALTAPPAVGFAYYVMNDAQTAYLAPTPDAIYPLRIGGQWRPAGISAANPTTWLSTFLGDLLVIAVILEAMLYQRDLGDPQNPQGVAVWESRFEDALKSAETEEAVKKGLGPSFQPMMPAPLANPPPPAPPA
jgi:hypothetical protein